MPSRANSFHWVGALLTVLAVLAVAVPSVANPSLPMPEAVPAMGKGGWSLEAAPTTRGVSAICDGGFEAGRFEPCWGHGGELNRSVVDRLDRGDPAYAGRYSALLGDPGLGEGLAGQNPIPIGSAWIQQQITVPNTPSPRLVFWYRIITYDVAQDDQGRFWDFFSVEVNGERVFWDGNKVPRTSQQRHDLGWKPGTVDLSRWRGRSITVRFVNWNGYSRGEGAELYNSWTYLDGVQITRPVPSYLPLVLRNAGHGPTITLEWAGTTDEVSLPRMAFVADDPITLWLLIRNSGSSPVNAQISWEVRSPTGSVVADLSWSGTRPIDPARPYWYLERVVPTGLPTGQYTFTGVVTYGNQTTTRSAVFYLAAELVLADDFSDPNSGWPIQSSYPADYEVGYVNETYRILVKTADNWVWSIPELNLTDYVVEADTWQLSTVPGASGFLLDLSDDGQQFLAYSVDNQGRYRLGRWTGTDWVTLVNWTATPALNTGQVANHLMVVRQGTQATLYANGQSLGTVASGLLAGRRLGAFAESLTQPNVDARYDNYRAYWLGGAVLTDGRQPPASGAGPNGLGDSSSVPPGP